jgi:predicted MFS family arabinose efflux permease
MPFALDPTTRLILVLGIGAGASALAGRALDPLVGVLAGEFGAAAASVAMLGTAFALPYALVQPVLGPIGDAMGKQRVIRGCLVALALALAISAAAPDLASLALLRILAGAAAGGIFPLAIATIGDRVPLERRQVALSRLLVAGLTGTAGGGAMGAALAPLIGWRGVLLVCAAIALAAVPVLRRDGAPPEPARRFDLVEALRRYRHILGQRAARVLYAAVFIEGSLVFGLFPFLAPFFVARGLAAGTGAAEAGASLAAFALGGFAFAAVAPALLRRMDQARMVVLGGAVAAGAMIALALVPLAWLAAAICLVFGLGFYMIHSSIQTRVTEVAPAARGSAVALHACCFFLGQSFGPVVMATAWAALGPVGALVVLAAALFALAVWLAPQERARGAAEGR